MCNCDTNDHHIKLSKQTTNCRHLNTSVSGEKRDITADDATLNMERTNDNTWQVTHCIHYIHTQSSTVNSITSLAINSRAKCACSHVSSNTTVAFEILSICNISKHHEISTFSTSRNAQALLTTQPIQQTAKKAQTCLQRCLSAIVQHFRFYVKANNLHWILRFNCNITL